MTFVWLGITVAAAIIEAIVPALVSIWFVPGGLAALVASLLNAPAWLQILLFAAFTVLAAVFTRPAAKRLQKTETSTNADRVLGAEAVVTEEVNNLLGAGRVSVMGNSWAARSVAPETIIPAGKVVTVSRIEGVKLIVSPSAKKGETL